jgi:hypothetical protein
VLESGCIPLPLLRAHMEAWLDGRAAQGRGR